jgi:isopenicillin-N epimerase
VADVPLENPLWGPDWAEVRALWSLDPSRAHLNHGSFGAVPIPVQRAQDELRRRVESNPMREFSRTLADELDAARTSVAAFLGAEVGGFAFVPNATTGANVVLASTRLGPGDEVLLTNHAYGGVRLAAERACDRVGARAIVQSVPLPTNDSSDLFDAVLAGVTERTRLAIVDHIASPTGLVFPVADLVAELRRRGVPVLVDGAHAPGTVDLELTRLGPDFWTGNFHKWCCAPRGSAGLWVREEHREAVAPPVTSWFIGDGYPASFRWLGTDDYTPYLAVPAALEFMRGLGWNRVRAHNRALARYGRDTVGEALGVGPAVDPALDGLFEAMTIVPLPDGVAATAEDVGPFYARVADELGVEVIGSAVDGRGYVRLSAQAYNAPADYERLAEGLPRLLGG